MRAFFWQSIAAEAVAIIQSVSLADVATRIGAKSRNADARYEQGTAFPTITKLAELFRAVDPDHELTLTVA